MKGTRNVTDEMALQIEPSRAEFEVFLDLQFKLVGLRIADFPDDLMQTYSRVEEQFKYIRNKYYCVDGRPVLRLAHNAQYTIFLYHFSRSLFARGDRPAADKLYALLRMVSCIDLYYEVALPCAWACDHPLGSVVGRAQFSDMASFFFVQNCTVGNNRGVYPQIFGNLHMYSGASVFGATRVAGNVVLASGTCVVDGGELRDCVVFGRSPDLTIKLLAEDEFNRLSAFKHRHSTVS